MKVVTHEDDKFLAIIMYVNDSAKDRCRIRFNNNNGLLTAYTNGTLVVGQQLILTQWDVRINSIRTHYTKNDQLIALKYPEIALTRVRAVIGSVPDVKSSVVQQQLKAEPELAELSC